MERNEEGTKAKRLEGSPTPPQVDLGLCFEPEPVFLFVNLSDWYDWTRRGGTGLFAGVEDITVRFWEGIRLDP